LEPEMLESQSKTQLTRILSEMNRFKFFKSKSYDPSISFQNPIQI